MQAILKSSSRYFYIGIHTCHRRVYLLWFTSICTVFWRLLYFCWYIRRNFRLFSVAVNFRFTSVRFQKICNEMILRHTSEAHILFLIHMYIMLIIRVPWIKRWFLVAFFLSILLKTKFIPVWTSTVTVPLLKKKNLIIYYWIFQIQIANL